jgi:hypothetical protein
MRMIAAVLACLGFAACAGSPVIVLQNPTTGELKECRAEGGRNSPFPLAQAMIDDSTANSCARGYVAAGWRRMN